MDGLQVILGWVQELLTLEYFSSDPASAYPLQLVYLTWVRPLPPARWPGTMVNPVGGGGATLWWCVPAVAAAVPPSASPALSSAAEPPARSIRNPLILRLPVIYPKETPGLHLNASLTRHAPAPAPPRPEEAERGQPRDGHDEGEPAARRTWRYRLRCG